jgi:hypothetical protein
MNRQKFNSLLFTLIDESVINDSGSIIRPSN